jgi:AcrR family transcriptional regulator
LGVAPRQAVAKASGSGAAEDRTGPRRRLKPAIRRLEILEAAARVMRRMGAAANVEEVAREAKAARGTFYLYFPSWEELALELRRLVFAEFARRGAEFTQAPADGDWAGQVDRLALAFVDFTLALGGLHEALFHGPGSQLPAGACQHTAAPLMSDVLVAGTRAGGFAVSDPEATARLIYAVMHETVDAICGGQDRERSLAAMRRVVAGALARAIP